MAHHIDKSGKLIEEYTAGQQPYVAVNKEENAKVITSTQKKWRDDFWAGNPIDTSLWEILSQGTGQTITNPAGVLTLATGTTADQEIILQSKEFFTVPCRLQIGMMLSQRIAQQEFYIELVSVDPNTGQVTNEGLAAWKFDGTTATQAKYTVSPKGTATRFDSGASKILSTASYSVFEIEMYGDEVWFQNTSLDSSEGRSNGYRKHQNIPHPSSLYKIRIRAKNLNPAPASSTTMQFNFASMIDYTEIVSEISASRGATAAGMALPVQVANNPYINASLLANNTNYTPDTSTNLAANATYTGSSRDMGSTSGYNRFRVVVAHQAGLTPGHLVYDFSSDGTTWRETHKIPIPSDGQYRTFEFPVFARYHRIRFVNGAIVQTMFYLGSSLVRSDGPFDLDKSLSFVHSKTNLAAAGSFVSTVLDLGSNHSVNRHRILVSADQAGTVYAEQSSDGSVWYVTNQQAVAANATVDIDDYVAARYVRVRYVNGAAAQTKFELISALVKN